MDGVTRRIPFEIKSFEIKKSLFLRQRIIDITFKKGGSYLFGIYPRVLDFKMQKSELQGLVDCLKGKTQAKRFPELKKIKGIKLRKQYLSVVLYIVFCILLLAFAGGMAAGLKTGTLNFEEVQDILEAMFLLCSPIIVMAVPNMFLYGKIICVVNKEGLYFENDFIPLDEIDSITYDLKFSSRRGAGYRCATISAGASLMERRSFNVCLERGGCFEKEVYKNT